MSTLKLHIFFWTLAMAAIFLSIIHAGDAVAQQNFDREARVESARTIYFAGGCFWGVEEYFSRLPGVLSTTAGYGRSKIPNPSYEDVCRGDTGAVEAVRVVYDSSRTSLGNLVQAFFTIIDPLAVNRQGNDIGPQYRTGIYFADEKDKAPLKQLMEKMQKKYAAPLATELGHINSFYEAEEYHQGYLKKNPRGYCHINFSGVPQRFLGATATDRQLGEALPSETFRVMRQNGTEAPFTGKYWDLQKPGIYVDAITGAPLFSSVDKFSSSCGWPSFSRPITPGAVTEKPDYSHNMQRTEVRSAGGDSHLGHVFNDGPARLGGLRYCINSAALRFIPVEDMAKAGYGDYIDYVMQNASDMPNVINDPQEK